jgi:putative ubiquitin-RnfH superfamily antitoxin RatB of RatAB toxin-antitoxin module
VEDAMSFLRALDMKAFRRQYIETGTNLLTNPKTFRRQSIEKGTNLLTDPKTFRRQYIETGD